VKYGNWLAANCTLGNESLMSVKFRLFKKLSGLPLGRTDPLRYTIRKLTEICFSGVSSFCIMTLPMSSHAGAVLILYIYLKSKETRVLGLKTGFLKMLLTFLHIHRYVNN
jgi:hypothetical protein